MIGVSSLASVDCIFSSLNLPYVGVFLLTDSRAQIHHPDKITDVNDRAASEAFFVHLKLAHDTLLNPAKRFAYDRFGPSVLQWQHCSSIRDYLVTGIWTYAPTYVGSAVALVVLSVTGYLNFGRFVS